MLRRITPLRGQALLEMIPADTHSAGGVFIPETARQEPATELSRAKLIDPRGTPVKGYVNAIGPWPLVKKGKHKGFQIMPEFKVGDLVIVPAHAGQPLSDGFGHGFKLVDQLAVLAVILPN